MQWRRAPHRSRKSTSSSSSPRYGSIRRPPMRTRCTPTTEEQPPRLWLMDLHEFARHWQRADSAAGSAQGDDDSLVGCLPMPCDIPIGRSQRKHARFEAAGSVRATERHCPAFRQPAVVMTAPATAATPPAHCRGDERQRPRQRLMLTCEQVAHRAAADRCPGPRPGAALPVTALGSATAAHRRAATATPAVGAGRRVGWRAGSKGFKGCPVS